MTPRQPVNIPASVRERLHNIAKEDGQDFNFILSEYATERFLHRLGESAYADQFILKGARLMALWSDRPFRSTRDLDLLGFGDATQELLRAAITAICVTPVAPDGLNFDVNSIQISEIRHQQKYKGQRVKLNAYLDKARILLQIDVGFGDAVTPTARKAQYSTLLKYLPAPKIRVYPRETVIAEKLHAMTVLGTQNTRLKDFFDVCMLAREFEFRGSILIKAIGATFACRSTLIPIELPPSLRHEFSQSYDRQVQWNSFLQRSGLVISKETDLAEVLAVIRAFIHEPLLAASGSAPFRKAWSIARGWHMNP